MRLKPKIDIQRREIAESAGVTPALVSYYFPEKWCLIKEAARPVLEAYTFRVGRILDEDVSSYRKVANLINLFIDFNYHQGYLLDFFLQHASEADQKDDLKFLIQTNLEIQHFFAEMIKTGQLRAKDSQFVQSSLWGLCKYIAQHPKLDGMTNEEILQALEKQSEAIFDFFVNGMSADLALSDYVPPMHTEDMLQ